MVDTTIVIGCNKKYSSIIPFVSICDAFSRSGRCTARNGSTARRSNCRFGEGTRFLLSKITRCRIDLSRTGMWIFAAHSEDFGDSLRHWSNETIVRAKFNHSVARLGWFCSTWSRKWQWRTRRPTRCDRRKQRQWVSIDRSWRRNVLRSDVLLHCDCCNDTNVHLSMK